MDENEWLNATDPQVMLDFLRETGRASERKRGLFGCACVRRVWTLLNDPRSRRGVETREAHLDRAMPTRILSEAATAARMARSDARCPLRLARGIDNCAFEVGPAWAAGAASLLTQGNYKFVSDLAARAIACVSPGGRQASCDPVRGAILDAFGIAMRWEVSYDAERAVQAALLRDIFGRLPFRRLPPLDASLLRWNDGTVRRISEGIYDERAFERMGALADALLDSGCDNEDILQHCRQQKGVHTKGCWVIDLLLGKE